MAESKPIQITEAEWPVMESVWQREGQTAGEVLARVPAENRSHRTLRTLLVRLVEKGFVCVRIEGSRHLYGATLSREECVRSAARTFKERFFSGNLQSMLMHFVEQESLSDDEIKELRQRLISRETQSKKQNRKKPRKN